VIGERPIDLHLEVLRSCGATIEEKENGIYAAVGKLRGGTIIFGRKSVGATEQGILAAVLAQGETVLCNCAREPEILWLCRYLEQMGASIRGTGTDCIQITGVKKLTGTVMKVPPDRIAAGTYLCACAATRGTLSMENPPLDELGAFLEVYRKIGGQYKVKSGKLIANAGQVEVPLPYVETEEYPGFPTDLQSPLMTVLATIPGESCIRETIFEERFKTAAELDRMGAEIRICGNLARIRGKRKLRGCSVKAEELRGGAALVLAGLAAEGETRVRGVSFIRRGYEDIARDLAQLGAQIQDAQC
jgi:UDP-N-acetylglucosamine 1-carboxyvinyltransferase